MKSRKNLIYLILLSVIIIPFFTFAQGTGNPPITITVPNPLLPSIGNNLLSLINAILNNVVLPVGAVVVVLWIIYAGFKYVTAEGNAKKLEEAHKTLIWALIGAGILLGSVGISVVVKNTINAIIAP